MLFGIGEASQLWEREIVSAVGVVLEGSNSLSLKRWKRRRIRWVGVVLPLRSPFYNPRGRRSLGGGSLNSIKFHNSHAIGYHSHLAREQHGS